MGAEAVQGGWEQIGRWLPAWLSSGKPNRRLLIGREESSIPHALSGRPPHLVRLSQDVAPLAVAQHHPVQAQVHQHLSAAGDVVQAAVQAVRVRE